MDKILDRYLIKNQIGEGGFGRVYLCEDTLLARQVAIKELRQRFRQDKDALRRFANDARVAASLDHSNIVTVFDLQPPKSPRYIVMEYLPRGPLSKLLDEKKTLSPAEAIPMAMQICKALQAVHNKGVIHRDIKPENVLLTDADSAKLCDFGVAHVPAELGGYDISRHPSGHPGDVRYMSPEQVKGQELDGRSDLYSLGAMLYRMVTGRHYFDLRKCKSLHDFFQAIVNENPCPACQLNPTIPSRLDRLILKLLSKEREQRFDTASEVLRALEELKQICSGDSVFQVKLVSVTSSVCRLESRYRFQVRIEGDNESGHPLGLSGLTINIPTINSMELFEASSLDTWSIGCNPPFHRAPGELIWAFLEDGSFGQKPAQSLLIESVLDTWKPRDRIALEAVLTAPCTRLDVHVRVWATRPTADGGSEGFGDPDWRVTGVRDQQGIPAHWLSVGFQS
jgi:serine/threonine protein kinase